ncbi:MAG: ammonium transporter [Candidatus Thiodiazotropha lotti]|uniref:Ammonium transporter n=1 Tax=Candidatus Thiodiazotropha lotti TaxID=2792787 RepID=A0A9E4N1S5_9GAMM|nr:ammonium transporter [Candidatus Thiodiazotropha lotti]ODC01247.1 hypothetical protein A3197_01850 [Candidatus Thiodiazotropha endoloripes]MCG7940743.1 ammonium transporter [Candidatus Thiodiazotropha lotti]MCG7988925.1 ammonium transporter [Candidatus Thiodiazotropha lotti]MCG8014209.1 ammonium transporter [Candidatus Thiodiazotropha lotti]
MIDLLVGIFSSTSLGIFSGCGFADRITSMSGQLGTVHRGVVTIAFTAMVTLGIFMLVDALIGLRINKEEEIEGLGIVLHQERGYNEIS